MSKKKILLAAVILIFLLTSCAEEKCLEQDTDGDGLASGEFTIFYKLC